MRVSSPRAQCLTTTVQHETALTTSVCEEWRYEEASTSRKQESAPMDVNSSDTEKGPERLGFETREETHIVSTGDRVHVRMLELSDDPVGSCQTKNRHEITEDEGKLPAQRHASWKASLLGSALVCVHPSFVTIGSCKNGPHCDARTFAMPKRHDCAKLRRGAQPDLRLTWQRFVSKAEPDHVRVCAASHLVE